MNNVVRASTFHFINKHYWLKGTKIFYLVFIEMQMYGPMQGTFPYYIVEMTETSKGRTTYEPQTTKHVIMNFTV